MTQISKDQVEHLAKLAKLHLDSEEIDLYQQELTVIIGFIDQLQEVDVDSLPATEQVSQMTNILRADTVNNQLHLNLEDLQQNNPNLIQRQFKVPKIN